MHTGYLHPAYAASLAQFGTPRQLHRSAAWVLERDIPHSRHRDLMGCYPIFACREWSGLSLDLDHLGTEFVSLTVVTDPFGCCDRPYLEHCFRDVVRPFKRHYIIDVQVPRATSVSRHHRRYALRALESMSVHQHQEPELFLDQWLSLHRTLTRRHNVSGIRGYSRAAFAAQLATPGMVVLYATNGQAVVGAQLWFVQGDVAYGHLMAMSAGGYRSGASYALHWSAIEHFRDKVRWLSLGGEPGLGDEAFDGLRWFKEGWATETRPTYLCGRIFDNDAYGELVNARVGEIPYFPAYRAGELG